MIDPANDFLHKDTERTLAGFIYHLLDYKHERLLSFVPIHAGESVSFKLSTGEFIRDAKVRQVHHVASMGCESGQVLEASLEFED